MFEGFQRRAAFNRYADLTNHIRDGLQYAYRLYGIPGEADKDVQIYVDLQSRVEPFPEVVDQLHRQRALGVKTFIFSDVETRFIEMYVSKLKGFTPDFVGSSEQARIHKPNPRVYRWVLAQVGLEARDVLYCAAPQFDIQGALGCGIKAAWLRPFTIFYYYQPQQLILTGDPNVNLSVWNGGEPLAPVPMPAVLFGVGLVGYAMALWTLTRRDLPAPL